MNIGKTKFMSPDEANPILIEGQVIEKVIIENYR